MPAGVAFIGSVFIGSAVVDSAAVGCSVSAGSARVGLAALLGASLPSVHELPQTLPNGAVDNRC